MRRQLIPLLILLSRINEWLRRLALWWYMSRASRIFYFLASGLSPWDWKCRVPPKYRRRLFRHLVHRMTTSSRRSPRGHFERCCRRRLANSQCIERTCRSDVESAAAAVAGVQNSDLSLWQTSERSDHCCNESRGVAPTRQVFVPVGSAGPDPHGAPLPHREGTRQRQLRESVSRVWRVSPVCRVTAFAILVMTGLSPLLKALFLDNWWLWRGSTSNEKRAFRWWCSCGVKWQFLKSCITRILSSGSTL